MIKSLFNHGILPKERQMPVDELSDFLKKEWKVGVLPAKWKRKESNIRPGKESQYQMGGYHDSQERQCQYGMSF